MRWAACLFLCAPHFAFAAPSVLRIGNGAEPESLDPHRLQTVTAYNIALDLYEGLTAMSPRAEPVPGAAERWDVSADGLEYIFHLRPQLHWSNGDPLTAEDFAAGLRRSVDPATGSAYSQVLAPIRHAEDIIAGRLKPNTLGVDVLDAQTLRIVLKDPTPYLPGLLSLPMAFPVHRPSLKQYGAQFARAGRLVSNGAYTLEDWVVHSQIRLARNPQYWNDRATQIDSVYFYPTEDVHSELKRYRAGELDMTFSIPAVQAKWLHENLGAELRTAPFLDTYYLGFNCARAPFQDRPRLRQALAMSLDRELITEKVLYGLGKPASGWVPDGVTAHTAQAPLWAAWTREKRLAEARRLYVAEGYSADKPLDVEIRYATNQQARRVAIVVAAMWKQNLGARVQLVNEELKVFLSDRRLKKTQVFLGNWLGDYNDAATFTDMLSSRRGQGTTGWSNARYEALLDRAAAERDAAARQALLEEAERIVLDETPLTPIYFDVSKHLVKPRVAGREDNVLDYHLSRYLQLH